MDAWNYFYIQKCKKVYGKKHLCKCIHIEGNDHEGCCRSPIFSTDVPFQALPLQECFWHFSSDQGPQESSEVLQNISLTLSLPFLLYWASLVDQMVKNLPAMAGDLRSSLWRPWPLWLQRRQIWSTETIPLRTLNSAAERAICQNFAGDLWAYELIPLNSQGFCHGPSLSHPMSLLMAWRVAAALLPPLSKWLLWVCGTSFFTCYQRENLCQMVTSQGLVS